MVDPPITQLLFLALGQGRSCRPFMAPEQVTGGSQGPTTDVYSVGALMYSLRVGRHPFNGQSQRALSEAILSQSPPDLAAATASPFSRRFALVVTRALAKRPQDRFLTALDMAAAVEALLREPPPSVPVEPHAAQPPLSARGERESSPPIPAPVRTPRGSDSAAALRVERQIDFGALSPRWTGVSGRPAAASLGEAAGPSAGVGVPVAARPWDSAVPVGWSGGMNSTGVAAGPGADTVGAPWPATGAQWRSRDLWLGRGSAAEEAAAAESARLTGRWGQRRPEHTSAFTSLSPRSAVSEPLASVLSPRSTGPLSPRGPPLQQAPARMPWQHDVGVVSPRGAAAPDYRPAPPSHGAQDWGGPTLPAPALAESDGGAWVGPKGYLNSAS